MSHQYLTLSEAADRLNRSIGDLFNLGEGLPVVAVVNTKTIFIPDAHFVDQLGTPSSSATYQSGSCVHLSFRAREALEAAGSVDLGSDLSVAHYEFTDDLNAFEDVPDLIWLGHIEPSISVSLATARIPVEALSRLVAASQEQHGVVAPLAKSAPNKTKTRVPTAGDRADAVILAAFKDLNIDPGAIEKWVPGKAGVKDQIRAKVTLTPSVFDKSWERLRKAKTIRDAFP